MKTYCWKALDCELCKFKFPDIIRSRSSGKTIKIMQFEKPESDYIVLESVTSQNIKIIHSVDLSFCDEIKVGRGHDCQIRITDISVSRNHAFIKKSINGEFIVEDNGSKFGTLVLVRKPMVLDKRSTNYLQAGRTILEVSVNQPDSNCCLNLLGIRGSRKVPIASLYQDEEGDFYPEEFLQKPNEFTREEEQPYVNKFQAHRSGFNHANILRPADRDDDPSENDF